MKRLCVSVAALLASTAAYAADLPTTKGKPVAPDKPNCFSSLYAYFDSTPADCPLSYWGLTFYATIDMGVGYQTHGVPFNGTNHIGAEEFINKNSNRPNFGLAPGGLSQSQVGVKIKEPLFWDWSVVAEVATGFDPYSLQLADGLGSMVQNNQTPLNLQSANADSSRAGQWDNSVAYGGLSNKIFGTITAGRQNSLTLDGVNAYDPMGGSYAFSPIGWSGKVAGAGGTEDARQNTSLKYALAAGNIHLNAEWQFGGYSLGNGSDGEYELGIGADFGGFSFDAIFTQIYDQVNLATYNGPVPKGVPTDALKATLSNNESVMLLGKYKWNQFTIYAGTEHIQYTNPSNNHATGFTTIGGQPVVSDAINSSSINFTNYTVPQNFDAIWTGLKYAATDRIDLTGAYYLYYQPNSYTGVCGPNTAPAVKNAGFSPQGSNSGKCTGYMNAFSGLVDYRPLKRVDLYAGVLYSQVSGGLANGYLYSNNWAPTAGIRVRF